MENKNQVSNFEIDIDNKEYLVSLKSPLFPDTLKELKSECIGLKIDECLELTSGGDLKRDILLTQLRSSIHNFRSNYFHLKLENQDVFDPIVCRCMAKTVKDLKDLYHAHKGDKKKIFVESHVAGVCGSCLGDFNSFYKEFEQNKAYVNGMPASVWIDKVEKLIEEFYFVCPAEYSNLKFTVISMNSFNLKIRCDRGESKIGRIEVMETLSNYFKSELKLDLKLSVVI